MPSRSCQVTRSSLIILSIRILPDFGHFLMHGRSVRSVTFRSGHIIILQCALNKIFRFWPLFNTRLYPWHFALVIWSTSTTGQNLFFHFNPQLLLLLLSLSLAKDYRPLFPLYCSATADFVEIYLSALLLFSKSLLWQCSIVPTLLWLSSTRPISYKLIMVRRHTKNWVAAEWKYKTNLPRNTERQQNRNTKLIWQEI